MDKRKKTEENLILYVENVGKDYVLGAVTGNTLKDAIRLKRKGKANDCAVEEHNKKFTALDDVSFKVRRGECVGIIGSNGAGKSTLLKIISRITAPTRGKVCIDGKVASMLEVGTGFHPELTGRENIYLNGSILGMKRNEIDSKIESIIEFSECAEFIDTPVKRYSSGMYVKLAFSVAAHLNADIMIMDEVLAVGDVSFQHKCLAKMKEIARTEGRTILYVSHNMDTISTLCDRCIVLNHGKLIFDGDVSSALRLYNGDDLKTEVSGDFSKYLRPGWLGRDDVRITWAEYLGDSNHISSSKDLTIEFKYLLNADVSNAGIRVEIMKNTDKPFATFVRDDVFSGREGESGEFRINLDTSQIQNGFYRTFYTVFVKNPYDESVDLDCVRGLDIIIDRKHEPGQLKWHSKSWGDIRL